MKIKFTTCGMFLTLLFTSLSVFVQAQTTYTWNGGTSSWNTAGNWTPARTTPAIDDILIIDASHTIVLDFTSPQSIGQLRITGGSSAVSFQTGANRTLNIGASLAGDDFTISAGSSLTVQSTVNSTALTIALGTGNTGKISGALNYGFGASTAQAHRLTSPDAEGISFENGSSFTTISVSSGSPFGTTGAAPTYNNIVFKSGSTYNNGGGANPFGASAPASLVQFQSGSDFWQNSTSAPSFSNRYYANFILNATIPSNTGSFGKMDNLTIKAGKTFTVGSTNNRFSITGNITVEATGSFVTVGPAYPDLLLIGNGALQVVDFGSSTPSFRSISVGTDAVVAFVSNSGINAASTASGVTSNIYGNLNLGTSVLTGTAGTGTPVFNSRSANSVATEIGATPLNANSNLIVSNNPTGVSNGMLVNFPGVFPANTYIISTSSGTFTTSKYSIAAAATGTAFTITNGDATVSTSHSDGLSGALPGTYTYSLNGNFIFNAATTTAFPATSTVSAESITINENVTLNTQTSIAEVLTVAAGKTLATGGLLTLKSTATGTARVASTTGTISGDVTVERYISDIGRKWRLLSGKSTTTTQTIFSSWQDGGSPQIPSSGFGTWITAPGTPAGYDDASLSSSILTHNPAVPSWVTPAATNSAALSSQQGYMLFVRGDRSADGSNAINNATVLRSTGTLNQGTQPAVTILNANPGYTLVGNPYASPLDLETVLNTANLGQFFQVWDATEPGNFGVGKFRVVQKTGAGTYTATPTTGNDNTTRYIHSGQAFFLKATGGNASVAFTEAQKASLLSVVQPRNPTVGDQQLYTELVVLTAGNTESVADAVRVWYNPAFSAGTTDDLPKMGNFGENISSYREGKKFIVEQRPMITSADTIFLRSSNLSVNNYRFKINTIDFVQTNLPAFLVDNFLNTVTPINLTGTVNDINFSVTADAASAAADRFMIVFAAAGPLPVTITSVKAQQQQNNIAIEWKVSNQYNMATYEVEKSTNGINFSRVNTQNAVGSNGSDATYTWLDVNPAAGSNYYRIRSIGMGSEVKISQQVKVTVAKGNPAISIYPNPVVSKTFAIEFAQMEKGTYQLRFINAAGQLVAMQQVNHSGGNSTQTVNLNSEIVAGNYQLQIIHADGSKSVRALLVSDK